MNLRFKMRQEQNNKVMGAALADAQLFGAAYLRLLNTPDGITLEKLDPLTVVISGAATDDAQSPPSTDSKPKTTSE